MCVRLCLLSRHSVIIHFMARKRRRFSERGIGTWWGVEGQTEYDLFVLCWQMINNKRGLFCLITDLVVLSTFLYAGQPNNRLAVLQSLVKNGVGVTFDLFLVPLWSFVVFFYLFPLYVLQSLEAERSFGHLYIMRPTANLWPSLSDWTVFTSLPVSRCLWPKPCFHVSSSCWRIYWKSKLSLITWHELLDA